MRRIHALILISVFWAVVGLTGILLGDSLLIGGGLVVAFLIGMLRFILPR